MTTPLIALDADGVLLHYNAMFPVAWQRAFGEPLQVQRPGAYHAATEYGVSFLDEAMEQRYRDHFDEALWRALPALPGAVEACRQLVEAGYRLVCVSSLPQQYQQARFDNLQAHGFPIEAVLATGHAKGRSTKTDTLNALAPVAFVDDLALNFEGLQAGIHTALLDAGQFDSPNRQADLSRIHSRHGTLAEFAQWWLHSR